MNKNKSHKRSKPPPPNQYVSMEFPPTLLSTPQISTNSPTSPTIKDTVFNLVLLISSFTFLGFSFILFHFSFFYHLSSHSSHSGSHHSREWRTLWSSSGSHHRPFSTVFFFYTLHSLALPPVLWSKSTDEGNKGENRSFFCKDLSWILKKPGEKKLSPTWFYQEFGNYQGKRNIL